MSEAVLSAMPSMSERLVLDAPMDIRNMGMTEYTILTEVSVRKQVLSYVRFMSYSLLDQLVVPVE